MRDQIQIVVERVAIEREAFLRRACDGFGLTAEQLAERFSLVEHVEPPDPAALATGPYKFVVTFQLIPRQSCQS